MPDFLTLEQAQFDWVKADGGYYWEPNGTATSAKGYKAIPPFLRAKSTTSAVQRFKPLDDPALFLKFAKLQPNEQAIIDFADKYGRLTNGVSVSYQSQGSSGFYDLEGESFMFWKVQIERMASAFHVWELIDKFDTEGLSKIVQWESGRIKYRTHLLKPTLKDSTYNHFVNGDLILPGKLLLIHNVNKQMEEHSVRPRLMLEADGKPVTFFYPSTLLAAIWLQLFKVIMGERRLVWCPFCNTWDDATDRRKKAYVHPGCANNARVKKFREDQKRKKAAQAKGEGNGNGNKNRKHG